MHRQPHPVASAHTVWYEVSVVSVPTTRRREEYQEMALVYHLEAELERLPTPRVLVVMYIIHTVR